MGESRQVIDLLTQKSGVLIFRMICEEANERMIRVEDQSFLFSEHSRIHSVHIVHLHHILHTTAFLRESDHGCRTGVLQTLRFHFQLILMQIFPEKIGEKLDLFFAYFVAVLFQLFRHIRIDPQETDGLVLHGEERHPFRLP